VVCSRVGLQWSCVAGGVCGVVCVCDGVVGVVCSKVRVCVGVGVCGQKCAGGREQVASV